MHIHLAGIYAIMQHPIPSTHIIINKSVPKYLLFQPTPFQGIAPMKCCPSQLVDTVKESISYGENLGLSKITLSYRNIEKFLIGPRMLDGPTRLLQLAVTELAKQLCENPDRAGPGTSYDPHPPSFSHTPTYRG